MGQVICEVVYDGWGWLLVSVYGGWGNLFVSVCMVDGACYW